MRTRFIIFIVAALSLTIFPTSLTSNAAPNPIEIISIAEVSSTSVEILFDSSISKKTLSYYVINAVVTSSVGMPKNIKKVIKTKSNGLITTVVKDLNPKAIYNFSVSAKTNKAKMISSEAVEYSSLSNLMDVLSNLPADWGNPKPIQLPTPAPTTAPVVLPAFTLTASSETRTVNTAATGFTINSTGSTITSFAINATPPNMSFNTTTGALTGTPNTIAGATAYTITSSNASGSATQTFTLTVTAAPTAISVAAIAGVTAPVRGATPVSTTTVGTGYTGTATWSGSPATFAPGTTYTATITLTPTSGYTLTGVTENFFTVAGATSDINPANSGVITAVFPATGYSVGDRGPGGGIVYYVSASNFTSTGSTCGTVCKYLEVAPATWRSGIVADDLTYQWSNDTSLATGQNTTTAATESGFTNERLNWKIGQGFSNTSVMKVSGATSAAQAAVLAYAGSATAGQWFIPSLNELNELCKYARGQTTGVLTVACISTGTLKTGTANDLGGFVALENVNWYWSSSEFSNNRSVYAQNFNSGNQGVAVKGTTFYVRPVRAF